MSTGALVLVIGLLAAGTYGFRLAGPLLRDLPARRRRGQPPTADRLVLSEPIERLLTLCAVALLAALAATAALTDGHGLAGVARPVGVLAGVLAAWLRAPFLVVVVIAAATAAGLRLLGVP